MNFVQFCIKFNMSKIKKNYNLPNKIYKVCFRYKSAGRYYRMLIRRNISQNKIAYLPIQIKRECYNENTLIINCLHYSI